MASYTVSSSNGQPVNRITPAHSADDIAEQIRSTLQEAELLEAQHRLAVAKSRKVALQRRMKPRQVWQPLGSIQNQRAATTPKQTVNLQESATMFDGNMAAFYSDYLDLFRTEQFWPIIGTQSDRRYGAFWPFYRTELELTILRAASRVVAGVNPHAQGLVGGVCAYVIAEGIKPEVLPRDGTMDADDRALCDAVRDVIDEFNDRVNFPQWQQMILNDVMIDGEVFLRMHDCEGKLDICNVSPELIRQPPGTEIDHWAFGIHAEPGRIHHPLAYWQAEWTAGGSGIELSADDVIHQPLILPGRWTPGIKRGLPLFTFGMRDCLESANKVERNVGEGVAVRAAFAYVRQWESATQSAVEDFNDSDADYTSARSYNPEVEDNVNKAVPGHVEDVPAGMTFLNPPTNPETAVAADMINMLLRTAASALNAPEWIVSADGSNNNFASSLTVESPFVRRIKQMQAVFGKVCVRVWGAAVRLAVKYGRLPEAAIHRVRLGFVAQSPETRNLQEEASVNTQYIQAGVKSRQTVAAEQNLDFDREFQNNLEFQQKTAEAQAKMQAAMPQPAPGGAEGGDAGPTQQAAAPMPGAQDGEPDKAGDLDPFGDVQECREMMESLDIDAGERDWLLEVRAAAAELIGATS